MTTNTYPISKMKKLHLKTAISGLIFASSAAIAFYVVFRPGSTATVDLAVYREAGIYVAHGNSPYASGFGAHLLVHLAYVYPPVCSLLFVPFNFMSPDVTRFVWTSLTIAEIVVAVSIVFRGFLSLQKDRYLPLLLIISALCIWNFPVASVLDFGQIDFLIMFLVLVDLVGFENKTRPKWIPRGVLVGIAAALKLTPGVFIIYFLFAKEYKEFRNSVAGFLGSTLVGFIFMFDGSKVYWFHFLIKLSNGDSPLYYSNQSLDGIFRRLIPYGKWYFLWVPSVVVMMVFGFYGAIRAKRLGQNLAAVTLVGITSVLIAPISWLHELVWIVPLIGFWWGNGKNKHFNILAFAYFAFTVISFPKIGENMISGHANRLVGYALENSFGVSLIVVVLTALWWINAKYRFEKIATSENSELMS